jgi:hypothetical protein
VYPVSNGIIIVNDKLRKCWKETLVVFKVKLYISEMGLKKKEASVRTRFGPTSEHELGARRKQPFITSYASNLHTLVSVEANTGLLQMFQCNVN